MGSRLNRRSFLKTGGMSIAALSAGGYLAGAGAQESASPNERLGPAAWAANGAREGLRPYSAQLHIHGLTNHNGHELSGSMQWHIAQAQAIPLDVIWWTDHSWLQTSTEPSFLHLGPGRLDPSTLHVHDLGLSSPDNKAYPRLLAAEVTGGTPAARKDGEYLEWELTNESGHFESFSYSPRLWVGDPSPPKGNYLARAVPSHPHLVFDLKRGPLGPDARVELLVRLSWHFQRGPMQQSILYRFVGAPSEPQRSVRAGRQVIVTVPTRSEGQVVDLDVYADAALLPDGTDNDVQDFSFIVRSRNGAKATARIGRFRMRTEQGTGEESHVYACIRDAGKRYDSQYGVTQHVNYELTSRRTVEVFTDHFTHFLPEHVSFLPPFKQNQATYQQLTSWHHQNGGLTAYAHPFGTHVRVYPAAEQDRMVDEVAGSMLQHRGYGADMIEVGYRRRGGCDLEHHLRLWDTLTGNGLFLCGTGASDSHGGLAEELPNPFVTWIWARSTTREDLIEGLRERRAYFGNPHLYQGGLDLSLGPLRMGESGVVEADEEELQVALDPWPDNAVVVLVQGLIRPGRPLNYLHLRTRVDRGNAVRLDTSRNCFVRVEVYQPDGELLVASNPIVALKAPSVELVQSVEEVRQAPSATVRWRVSAPAARTGVRWWVGPEGSSPCHFVRGTKEGAVYSVAIPLDGLEPGQTVSYRIRARGDGWGVTWPAWREPPLQVVVGSGGEMPSEQAPGLVVTGLAALPTKAGASISLNLSAAAQVQARILNIAGRPIKTLCRAKTCEAGTNTLLWNAQSDTGLPVPSGTYLVEVSATAPDGSQAKGLGQVPIRR